MVFLHGFCNSFTDCITRAAFNQAWFAASGVAASRTTSIAFSWPSLGKLIAVPPHLLPHDYRQDQAMARNSGAHVLEFLRLLRPLLQQVRARGRRCFLLAHSMGNYVLQSAVQTWFARGLSATTLFDEAILAAADERDDSFAQPAHGRLSKLPALAERITIYHSVRDVAMYLSLALNLIERIGFEGPDDKSDLIRFPPERFRIADAACVDDYDLLNPPQASHEYYRRSLKIREDIVAVMRGDPRINQSGPFRL
jgi:esterase/lipase superfamily enzyme